MDSAPKTDLEKKVRSFFSPGGVLSKKLPGYEPRFSQALMAHAVLQVIEGDGVLIVEAATGTGKTMAYLVPALAAGKRVVVSTGTKNLQEQLFFKDVPFLKELGGKFKAAVMKGRSNYLCHRKLNLFRKQPLLRGMEEVTWFGVVEDWSQKTETGDFGELSQIPEGAGLLRQLSCAADNCTGRACDMFENCWLVKMRAKAAEADIVIVNHHLLFADMSVREGGFGAVIPEYDRVILDEAHEIEHVATSYFGMEMSNWRIEELTRDAIHEYSNEKINNNALAKATTEVGNKGIDLFKSIKPASDRFQFRDVLDSALEDKFQKLFEAYQNFEAAVSALDKIPESLHNLVRRSIEHRDTLQMIFDCNRSDYVYWGEKRGKSTFLKASPINIAGHIKNGLLEEKQCVVLTSATLTVEDGFDFLRNRLGIAEAQELKLDSHFDYKKQTRLYVPTHLPDPNQAGFMEMAIEEMVNLLNLTKGRAFLLFTSLRNMETAYELLKDRVPYKLLLQGTGSRQSLLDEFRKDEHSVLLASASFWQGVDVKGEGLSLVVIDKLPFAVPDDPLLSARIKQIQDEGGNAFKDLQIPSAALSLKQGLGRLIRGAEDQGIMAVLDGRLVKKYYGKIFIRSLHGSPLVNNYQQLASWWKGMQE